MNAVSIYVVKIAGHPWHWAVTYNGEFYEGTANTMAEAFGKCREIEAAMLKAPLIEHEYDRANILPFKRV